MIGNRDVVDEWRVLWYRYDSGGAFGSGLAEGRLWEYNRLVESAFRGIGIYVARSGQDRPVIVRI